MSLTGTHCLIPRPSRTSLKEPLSALHRPRFFGVPVVDLNVATTCQGSVRTVGLAKVASRVLRRLTSLNLLRDLIRCHLLAELCTFSSHKTAIPKNTTKTAFLPSAPLSTPRAWCQFHIRPSLGRNSREPCSPQVQAGQQRAPVLLPPLCLAR